MAWGEQARDQLLAREYPVQWHAYNMPHAVCPQEIGDIGDWLRGVLDTGRIGGKGSAR
jgi:phospholipase/carboxylesterase